MAFDSKLQFLSRVPFSGPSLFCICFNSFGRGRTWTTSRNGLHRCSYVILRLWCVQKSKACTSKLWGSLVFHSLPFWKSQRNLSVAIRLYSLHLSHIMSQRQWWYHGGACLPSFWIGSPKCLVCLPWFLLSKVVSLQCIPYSILLFTMSMMSERLSKVQTGRCKKWDTPHKSSKHSAYRASWNTWSANPVLLRVAGRQPSI